MCVCTAILTLPYSKTGGNQYFPASYVKYLESGGARGTFPLLLFLTDIFHFVQLLLLCVCVL